MAVGLDENGDILYRDENGREWKFSLIFAQGDMEQLCQSWGLPSYGSVDAVCGMCLGSRDDDGYNHTHLQEDANWRHTCPLHNDVLTKC